MGLPMDNPIGDIKKWVGMRLLCIQPFFPVPKGIPENIPKKCQRNMHNGGLSAQTNTILRDLDTIIWCQLAVVGVFMPF